MTRLDAGLLEVVCMSYDLFVNNADTIATYEWLLVVFDEVHLLKNPTSKRYPTRRLHPAHQQLHAPRRLKALLGLGARAALCRLTCVPDGRGGLDCDVRRQVSTTDQQAALCHITVLSGVSWSRRSDR